MDCYKIVRFYWTPGRADGHRRRTIETGLSLAEAQAHCNDPETSSSTAKGAKARRISAQAGCSWFDGYEEE